MGHGVLFRSAYQSVDRFSREGGPREVGDIMPSSIPKVPWDLHSGRAARSEERPGEKGPAGDVARRKPGLGNIEP